MISLKESILGSTKTGAHTLIENWLTEHNIFSGHWVINSDNTISRKPCVNELILRFEDYTELPSYIKFKDDKDLFINISPEKQSYRRLYIDSFRGFPSVCYSFTLTCDNRELPALDITVANNFTVRGSFLKEYKDLKVHYTGGNETIINADGERKKVTHLRLHTGAPLDNVKIDGPLMYINLVNDFNLGDKFSKAMRGLGEMNKRVNQREFPCNKKVFGVIKDFFKGIDTSDVVQIEYTQNSKIVRYKGDWYRCKNW